MTFPGSGALRDAQMCHIQAWCPYRGRRAGMCLVVAAGWHVLLATRRCSSPVCAFSSFPHRPWTPTSGTSNSEVCLNVRKHKKGIRGCRNVSCQIFQIVVATMEHANAVSVSLVSGHSRRFETNSLETRGLVRQGCTLNPRTSMCRFVSRMTMRMRKWL